MVICNIVTSGALKRYNIVQLFKTLKRYNIVKHYNIVKTLKHYNIVTSEYMINGKILNNVVNAPQISRLNIVVL